MRLKLYALLIGFVGLWLTACDLAYPPIVVNNYPYPIEVSLSFAGGRPSQTGVSLPARTEYIQRQKGMKLTEITVKEPSGRLHIYQAVDLEEARSRRHINYEVWILSEKGLKLANKEDLKTLRASWK